MNNELKAESSLCWTCKFGVCLKETEQERVSYEAPDSPPEDIFSESQAPEVLDTIIEHERIRTVCFWRPENIKESPPISVSKIEQCNRFKKE
jgi:hypothetical protein